MTSSPSKPLIVAEMGASHNGSLRNAIELVESAAGAGADAIKLQTYTADEMVADKHYVIPSGPWAGKNLHALYEQAMTPWEWVPTLMQVAKDNGIECFSTPFSEAAVDFLEHLGCPRYKIASFELVDLSLIQYAAKTGKPLIMSTGMASSEEIQDAVDAARVAGAHDITLLKCTSSYPADPAESNILTMADMRTRFGCAVGISDHTKGVEAAIVASVFGCQMFEKHIRLSNQGGLDIRFAITPSEFDAYVQACRNGRRAMGEVVYMPTASEAASRNLRRSLYVVKDVRAGEKLTADNVQARRPALGAHPSLLGMVLDSATARMDMPAGTPLSADMFTLKCKTKDIP